MKAARATNPADQEMHRHLAEAKRALLRAMDVCARVGRSGGPLLTARRARDYRMGMSRMLREMDAFGLLTPDHVAEVTPPKTPIELRREKQQKAKADKQRQEQEHAAIWQEDDKSSPLSFLGDDEDEVIDLGDGDLGDDEAGD